MEASLGLRVLGALTIVGGLLLALRYLAMRFAAQAPPSAGRMLRVVESAALPGACSLHLVAVAEHRFVVGRSASQLSLLYELPDDDSRRHAHSDR
jgi:flagellar biogenesis protein FliO